MITRLHKKMQQLPKSVQRYPYQNTVPCKALLVLPYISVVLEKADQLSGLVQALKWKVQGYLGSQEGVPLSKKVSVSRWAEQTAEDQLYSKWPCPIASNHPEK